MSDEFGLRTTEIGEEVLARIQRATAPTKEDAGQRQSVGTARAGPAIEGRILLRKGQKDESRKDFNGNDGEYQDTQQSQGPQRLIAPAF